VINDIFKMFKFVRNERVESGLIFLGHSSRECRAFFDSIETNPHGVIETMIEECEILPQHSISFRSRKGKKEEFQKTSYFP
jgi:hypothetical protein